MSVDRLQLWYTTEETSQHSRYSVAELSGPRCDEHPCPSIASRLSSAGLAIPKQ